MKKKNKKKTKKVIKKKYKTKKKRILKKRIFKQKSKKKKTLVTHNKKGSILFSFVKFQERFKSIINLNFNINISIVDKKIESFFNKIEKKSKTLKLQRPKRSRE